MKPPEVGTYLSKKGKVITVEAYPHPDAPDAPLEYALSYAGGSSGGRRCYIPQWLPEALQEALRRFKSDCDWLDGVPFGPDRPKAS